MTEPTNEPAPEPTPEPTYSLEDLNEARRTGWAEGAEHGYSTARGQIMPSLFATEARLAAIEAGVRDPSLFDDPEVARRLLALDDVPLTDGQIDRNAIRAAVDALIEHRPYLKGSDLASKPAPQGARGGVQLLSRADLSHLTADEVARLHNSGALSHLFE